MKAERREAQERRKTALMRNKVREVGQLLEPGERVSAVMEVELDWRRSTRGVRILLRCLEAVWALWLLLSLAFTSLRNDFPRGFIITIVLVVMSDVVSRLIRAKARKSQRVIALTDRRVLLLRTARQGSIWRSTSHLVIEVAHAVGRVRVDAVRPQSSRRLSLGLRCDDGSTTELFFDKQWLPEVEWLASCLDAGVAAPRRPDVLSA